MEHFRFMVNSRVHLDPPVTHNYFGNCFVPCIATTESTLLMSEDGLLVGVELIGEAISEIVNNGGGPGRRWFKMRRDMDS